MTAAISLAFLCVVVAVGLYGLSVRIRRQDRIQQANIQLEGVIQQTENIIDRFEAGLAKAITMIKTALEREGNRRSLPTNNH